MYDGCQHGVSCLIEPPDEQGWMRESCGCCGQILRYTLWPHHSIALAALSERSECTCTICAEQREQEITN